MMYKKLITYAVPLALVETMGELRGKTRMQKLTFFVERKTQEKGLPLPSYNHELYHYGPFSLDLCFALDDLLEKEYLHCRIEEYKTGKILYTYSLTPKGKTFLNELRRSGTLSKEIDSIIRETVEQFGGMPLPELVRQAHVEVEEEQIILEDILGLI